MLLICFLCWAGASSSEVGKLPPRWVRLISDGEAPSGSILSVNMSSFDPGQKFVFPNGTCVTPLMLAIRLERIDWVAWLLDTGANPDRRCSRHLIQHRGPQLVRFPAEFLYLHEPTPLTLALQGANVHIVTLLLNKGVNVDAAVVDEATGTLTCPLAIAVSSGDFDLVSLLLKMGADVNCSGAKLMLRDFKSFVMQLFWLLGISFFNPISVVIYMRCCRTRRYVFITAVIWMMCLLVLGISPQDRHAYLAMSPSGNPLAIAVMRSNTRLVNLLLFKNANVHLKLWNQSLMALAAKAGNSEIVRMLLERAPSFHQVSDSMAVRIMDRSVILSILLLAFVHFLRTRNGQFLLISLLFLLLNAGAILAARFDLVRLPLAKSLTTVVLEGAPIHVIEELIRHGLDIKTRIMHVCPPLYYSALLNRQDVYALLAKYS